MGVSLFIYLFAGFVALVMGMLILCARYDGVPGMKFVDVVTNVINATTMEWVAEHLVRVLYSLCVVFC